MSAYLKRLGISGIEEVGVDTTKTQYMKRVEIVEVVDSDGRPWEPVPGPDPWDELVLVFDPILSGEPLVGSTLTMTPGVFTGGSDQQFQDDQIQVSNDGSAWSWFKQSSTHQLTSAEAGKYFRAASYVYDGDVEASGVSETIGPVLMQWETISQTIEGNSYDPNVDGAHSVEANSPIICAVSVANAPSDLTYEWSRRGSDPTLIGTPTAAQTAITFPEQGVFTVTVSLKSNLTAEWESAIFTFMVS